MVAKRGTSKKNFNFGKHLKHLKMFKHSPYTHEDGTKKKKRTSVVEDTEKLEHLGTVGESAKWCSIYGKQYGGSPKNCK